MSAPAAAGVIIELEPDRLRLTSVQAALVDQLVERRQARGGGLAFTHRREVMRDIVIAGLAAVHAEGEGS